MATIKISNPTGTREMEPLSTATHARAGHQPGDVYDPREASARLNRGERVPWISGGEHHDLRRYRVGALVLIPDAEEVFLAGGEPVRVVADLTKWTCWRVESNPCYEPSAPSAPSAPGYQVSFDEFNVRRHGQEP